MEKEVKPVILTAHSKGKRPQILAVLRPPLAPKIKKPEEENSNKVKAK